MQDYCSPIAPSATVRNCGVLVADDEAEIRDVLEVGLQREGFRVWLAADGQEALSLYRVHHANIDVVLLDVLMPRLDGLTTLDALKSIGPTIPCCVMSGYFGEHTEAGLRAKGAHTVFAKPFHLPEVAHVLRTLAGRSAPMRPPSQGEQWNTPTARGDPAFRLGVRATGSFGSGTD